MDIWIFAIVSLIVFFFCVLVYTWIDSESETVFATFFIIALGVSLYAGYSASSSIVDFNERLAKANELLLKQEGLTRAVKLDSEESWFKEYKIFRYKDIKIEYAVADSVIFIMKE